MSTDIQQVRPGDLIAASLFNELIEKLQDHEDRLDALEAAPVSSPPPDTGPIAITSITPGSVTEGDTITIVGENFGPTLGDAIVSFNGTNATNFTSWSDTQIVCAVPSIPALDVASPPASLSVGVQVSNFLTSATRFITVAPRTHAVTGTFEIVFEDASPDPLTAGTNNDFEFLVTSNASQAITISLTPAVTGASFSASLLDSSKNALSSSQVTVASGAHTTVFVRVAVPTGTNGQNFQVALTGTAPPLANASSGAQSFTVGQFADPDETFTLAPTTTSPSGALSGTTLSAKVGQELDVFMDAEFTVADDYEVTLALVPSSASGWQTVIGNPAAGAGGTHVITVTQQDVNNAPNNRVAKTIELGMIPSSGATDIQLRVVVKGASATASRTFTFDVHPHA